MFQASTSGVTSAIISRVELCFDMVNLFVVVKSMADANGENSSLNLCHTHSSHPSPAQQGGGDSQYSFPASVDSGFVYIPHTSPPPSRLELEVFLQGRDQVLSGLTSILLDPGFPTSSATNLALLWN
jgi:hypothetical protein